MDAERKKKKSASNKRSRQTSGARRMAPMPSSSTGVTVATKKMRSDSSAASWLTGGSQSSRTAGSSSRSRLLSKVMGTYASMSPGKRLSRSYSFDYEDVSSRSAISCSKLPASKADYDRGAQILASSSRDDSAATFDDIYGRYDDGIGGGEAEIDRFQMSYDEQCQQSNMYRKADDADDVYGDEVAWCVSNRKQTTGNYSMFLQCWFGFSVLAQTNAVNSHSVDLI